MSAFRKISVGLRAPDLNVKIRVALGHLHVDMSNIVGSIEGDANISTQRKMAFSQLLNDVVQHGARNPSKRIDLLVLPEVSVPHQWADFITKWAKNHKIGVICGLEHRVDRNDYAWNELLAALPFESANGSIDCVPVRRLKRHYSPEETFQIENRSLGVPNEKHRSLYQLFRWRGASFAVYNCYELASLEDRCLFKGKVDFIICSEYNQDINYFSNIVESAARDLHCYVVQVNCAQYGDSRVVSPSPTNFQNPLRMKGGDNQTFLTMELQLSELRKHQTMKYGLQKESKLFKPTPPDFSTADAKQRAKLGKKKNQ